MCFVGLIVAFILIFLVVGCVPSQTLFIELYHNLGTFKVSLFGRNQIRFISFFPLHQKHQLTGCIGGPNNAFSFKTTIKAYQSISYVRLKKFNNISKLVPISFAVSLFFLLDCLGASSALRFFEDSKKEFGKHLDANIFKGTFSLFARILKS